VVLSLTETIATTAEKSGKAILANIAGSAGVTANVAVYLYVIVAVLRQSDSELILPSSVFDLGGLLSKAQGGIPGGSFITPILQVQIPLTLFYTLAPIALLALHASLVLFDRGALARATHVVRSLAIWAPPVALALIRWRFAPYVSARPEPPPIGQAMESLQSVALGLDLILVMIATLRGDGAVEPRRRIAETRIIPARALRHASAVWLILALGALRAPGTTLGWTVQTMLPIVIAAVWLAEGLVGRRQARAIVTRAVFVRTVIREDLTMFGRAAVLGIYVVLLALPSFARQLDLSGQSLVSRTPSDTLFQTLLKPEYWKTGSDDKSENRAERIHRVANNIANARIEAWNADGVGISLAHWNFPGTRFERATMALITMTGTDLENASLDFTNLISADLRWARLNGASLRSAELDFAFLTGSDVAGANFSGASMVDATADRLVQMAADRSNLPIPKPTYDKDNAATSDEKDPCDGWPKGYILDLSNADLSRTNFKAADLRCANFTNSTMTADTDFSNAYLQGAKFNGVHDVDPKMLPITKLTGAWAGWIKIDHGIKLKEGLDISNTDFRHAILRGVDFHNVKGAATAKFNFADLTCAILPYDVSQAALIGAKRTGLRFAPPDKPEANAGERINAQSAQFQDSEQDPNDPNLETDCSENPINDSNNRSPQPGAK